MRGCCLIYATKQYVPLSLIHTHRLKNSLLDASTFQGFIQLAQEQKLPSPDSNYKTETEIPLGIIEQLCKSESGADQNKAYLNWRVASSEYRLEPDCTIGASYYGSYATAGMALALHIIHVTSSFKEAVSMAALMCGDADSVGSIVGQLAGSIYGVEQIYRPWLRELNSHPLKTSHRQILTTHNDLRLLLFLL